MNVFDDALWARIEAIDLTDVMFDVQTETGWDDARTATAERDYRRYLYITQKSPKPVGPSADVDQVWHRHLAYMQKYFHDCTEAFSRVLWHNPYPKRLQIDALWDCSGTTACQDGEDLVAEPVKNLTDGLHVHVPKPTEPDPSRAVFFEDVVANYFLREAELVLA